jgi:ribonuclease P protein component
MRLYCVLIMPKIASTYSFPSSFRLKNGFQIQEALSGARKYRDHSLSVFIKPNSLEYPRLAMVIARKNVGSAVKRNRLKRLIRESFRLNQDKIKGNDIIIFGYRGIEILTNSELRQCLIKNWQKSVSYQAK